MFPNNGTAFQIDGKWVLNKIIPNFKKMTQNETLNRMEKRTTARLFNQNIRKGTSIYDNYIKAFACLQMKLQIEHNSMW